MLNTEKGTRNRNSGMKQNFFYIWGHGWYVKNCMPIALYAYGFMIPYHNIYLSTAAVNASIQQNTEHSLSMCLIT